MADKDKEARAAVRESDEETSSPPQSEMVQTPCLSDIWKATGLGSRMNNLQDQINILSQCDLAVPKQNEDLMVCDCSEEAGGVSLDCAGSAQNFDFFC